MIKAYRALRDVNFVDGSMHVADRIYFPKENEQAYYEVCGAAYETVEIEEIQVGGRTIVVPDHPYGYTRSYLITWMVAHGACIPENFFKWMSGQTIGRSDTGESVYYTCDVHRYLTLGGLNAPVID